MIAAVVLGAGLALGALATTPSWCTPQRQSPGPAAASGACHAADLDGTHGSSTRARAFAWNVGLLVAWVEWGRRSRASRPCGSNIAGASRTCPRCAGPHPRRRRSVASVVLFRALRAPVDRTAHCSAVAPAPPLRPRIDAPDAPLVGLVTVWMLGPALAAPFFNIFFSRSTGFPSRASESCSPLSTARGRSPCWRAGGGASPRRSPGAQRGAALLRAGHVRTVGGWDRRAGSGALLFPGVDRPGNEPADRPMAARPDPARAPGLVSSWRQAAADVSA